MQFIRLIKYFTDRHNKSVRQFKKSEPAESEVDSMDKLFTGMKQIYERQGNIKKDTEEILRSIKGFNKTGLKSQIPYLTPKTCYTLYKRGWTIQEIMDVSGYSKEDTVKKIKSYNDNSVDV